MSIFLHLDHHRSQTDGHVAFNLRLRNLRPAIHVAPASGHPLRTFTGGSLSPPHSALKPKKHSAKANAWSNPSPTPESSLLVPRGASEEDLAEMLGGLGDLLGEAKPTTSVSTAPCVVMVGPGG